MDEQALGTLDPLDDRSCYPESKRAAETLLKSYLSPGQAPMIGFDINNDESQPPGWVV